MKLRTWLSMLSLALATTTLVAVFTLLFSAHQLTNASGRMLASLETVQAADSVALDLHRHRRQYLGWLESRDPARVEQAATRERTVLQTLQKSRAGANGRDIVALDQAGASVRRYLDASRALPSSPDPDRAYRASTPDFLSAQESVEDLASLAASEAEAAQHHARTLHRFVTIVGDCVAAAVAGITVLMVMLIRRRLVRPAEKLVESIKTFQRAGTVPVTHLPGEFGDIAAALATMASTIAEQRAGQLRFIASVAHDLRNPISSMKGYCWFARPGVPLPPEAVVRKAFEVIGRQLDRLNQQIGDLLDRSRMEAGAFELHCLPTDLAKIVEEVGTLFEAIAPDRIVIEVPGTLPLVADSNKLQQALTNLVSNSIKYSPGGGKVFVSARAVADELCVNVRDEGIGIAPADLPHIFEPFRRSDAVVRLQIPGVGLGLSTTRRIVEAHGGRIEVESQEGLGTTFRLHLPSRPRDLDGRRGTPGDTAIRSSSAACV